MPTAASMCTHDGWRSPTRVTGNRIVGQGVRITPDAGDGHPVNVRGPSSPCSQLYRN
jgi:hypothetical protein